MPVRPADQLNPIRPTIRKGLVERTRAGSPGNRLTAIPSRFVLDPEALDLIYPPAVRGQIERRVAIQGDPLTAPQVRDQPSLLAGVRALFSGWGAPALTEELLDAAEDLEVVFYGAGDTRGFFTQAARDRGIKVTSCNAVNAVPVIEYTMAQVVMCLKRVWQQARELKASRSWQQSHPGATGFGSTVGVLSLGDIGVGVAQRLAEMDVRVLVYDIHHDPELADRCSFEYADLDTVFRDSDVVTVHTPKMPETLGLVSGRLLESMKPGASLINTARGAIVDQPALVEVFRRRTDLLAVLDVVDPEPPAPDDPIWGLPNVVLTPHIAGSVGRECERMGRWVLDELRRYRAGEPMVGLVR